MAEQQSSFSGQAPWAVATARDPGLQRLAIAILERALDDLAGLTRGPRPRRRLEDVSPYSEDAEEALALLSDVSVLEPYCDLAGVSVSAVQWAAKARLRRMVSRSIRHLAMLMRLS